ncbi:MAG: hypothetical protein LBG58_13780 [Planctomycetaceae bacterium]|jgi:hypothetical protein|nr:hypothetical protein [Planctomycetaceae bacterium]
MKKYLSGFLLIFATVLGCTSQYQYQVEQSLLLQENQRLENALYVTHAQLVDLKRENDTLRGVKSSEKNNLTLPEQPLTRPKRNQATPVEDYDEAPLFTPPEIIIPKETPGSNTVPDSLKSSQLMLPEMLPKNVADPDEKSLPMWSANR